MRLLFSHFSADELQELWNHYDNGCKGYEVAFNRGSVSSRYFAEPALASKMNLYSDQFHHVTHKCSQAWRWPLGSNASSNESVNSWFAQFRSPAIGNMIDHGNLLFHSTTSYFFVVTLPPHSSKE